MTDDSRPIVFVDSYELAAHSDETWSALADWSGKQDPPGVLVKDGVLVRVTERALEPYDRYSLRDVSSRAARYIKMSARGNPNPCYPPTEVMDALLRRDPRDYAGVPRITAVVDVPVVARTGELVVEPGLHPSGVYYRPSSDLGRVNLDSAETVDEVIAARDFLLDELLVDFDFQDESDRANALGLVLLPFLRHFIGDDPTPMHAVTASQPGSGKSFLLQTCLIPGAGLVGMAPEPRNDEELRKLVTSSLLAARQAIVFDNVSEQIASGTLASALTSRKWQDRILGQSKEVHLPIRCIWASTGNWVTGTPEIVDRMCPIRLAARGEPARRRPASAFRHPDLHGWAIRNRSKLVSACLTLITHWLEGSADLAPDGTLLRHEHRQGSEATLGSFERWADVVGGVLAAADVHGFLGNLEEARSEMDLESEETRDFLQALHKVAGDRLLQAGEIAELCRFDGPLHQLLPTDVDTRDLPRSLREWLRAHRGQVHGGLSLVAVGPRPLKWRIDVLV